MECVPCGKTFTGHVCYQQHLASVKHKRKVVSFNMLKNSQTGSSLTSSNINAGTDLKQFHCDACGASFQSIESFQIHSIIEKHEKNISENQKSSLKTTVVSSTTESEVNDKINEEKKSDDLILLKFDNNVKFGIPVFATCDVCNKQFSGLEPYRQHQESAIHLKKVHLQNASIDQNVFSCEPCKKTFSGQVPYTQHMQSEIHKKKLQKLQLCEKYASEVDALSIPKIEENNLKIDNSSSVFCNICNVYCSGSIPYQQHLHGNTHIKNVNKAKVQDCILPELDQNLKVMSFEELHKTLKVFLPDETIDFDKLEHMQIDSANENAVDNISEKADDKVKEMDETETVSSEIYQICLTCNVQLPSINAVTSHYESIEHFVKKWRSN